MPVFGDAENRTLAPEGDYVFCVTEFEINISKGGKTNGCERYDVVLDLEMKNGQKARIWEFLIDHPSTQWKLDTFLKSCGIRLKKGENYEFNEEVAKREKSRFIKALGLRGHCRVIVEEYKDPKSDSNKKRNKVATFYTDKEKLKPREVEAPASAAAEDDVPF